MDNIECVHIDKQTTIPQLKNEFKWNEISYK